MPQKEEFMKPRKTVTPLKLTFICLLVFPVGGPLGFAGEEVSAREKITYSELTNATAWDEQPVQDLKWFMPAGTVNAAHHEFQGTLHFTTDEMFTEPEELSTRYPFNVFTVDVPILYDKADAKLFPGLPIQLFSHGDSLVPVTRAVIRPALGHRTASFWDIVVEPGKVWSEEADRGWSRASFPFALVSSLDGDTRNGVATFLFNDSEVSELRYQIAQQTEPFMQKDSFTAWGQMPMKYTRETIDNIDSLRKEYDSEVADRYPTSSWDELEKQYETETVESFETGVNLKGHITSALVIDGTIYYKPARTVYGEYPYTENMRFGVWSVSKTLTCGIAMLRLAEKYGPDVFGERLLDYFDESENNSGHDGWDKVTFANCLDMATGLGSEGGYWTRADINNWYYAYTLEDKMKHTFTEDNRPWGPGERFVYNDEDMWILGVAMDRYLKGKEGPEATCLKMLVDEVYRPIGVHNFCTTTTYTKDGVSPGTPHYAWGCLPTLDDLAKIADLLHNRGNYSGRQILNEDMCRQLFLEKEKKPIEDKYMMSAWYANYTDNDGNQYKVPYMSGMGGNQVVMMPNKITGIRICNRGGDTKGIVASGDALRPFKDFLKSNVADNGTE